MCQRWLMVKTGRDIKKTKLVESKVALRTFLKVLLVQDD